MRNCLFDKADHLEVTLPYAVTAGQGVLVGRTFGFAITDGASGARINIKRTGVFSHAKATGAGTNWTAGGAVYWDNTARVITGVLTSNTLIGQGYTIAATGDATGQVVLVPAP